MRKVVRNGLAIALLWLAQSSFCLAQVDNGIPLGNNHDISDSAAGRTYSDSDSSMTTTQSTTTATTTTTFTSPSSLTRSPATCRSGTVNYITHSLPQLCPTSVWTAPSMDNSESPSFSVEGQEDTTVSSTNHATHYSNDHGSNSTVTQPSHTSLSESNAASSSAGDTKPQSSQPVVTDDKDTTTSTSETLTSASVQAEPTDPATELETDSPLDNVNFLSFEEWKKQNLEKAGQSPDGGQRSAGGGQTRTRPDIALDALGDEGEIELDFRGFGSGSQSEETAKGGASDRPALNTADGASSNSPTLRSKDAGKTCKERSNYASFDCAATILKANPEAKSTSAILIENKDSYMLNPCSASNNFIIIELCDDILIDTIVLANYEFFSSIFRTFRVSVSDKYPVKPDKWKELGVFEATNSRSVQAFLVEHSLIWARYLRIEFLTHFGSEYYCPVSLLRVHGTTMMEEFRNQEYINRGEHLDDGDDDPLPLVDDKVRDSIDTAIESVSASVVSEKTIQSSNMPYPSAEADSRMVDGDDSSSAAPPADVPPAPPTYSASSGGSTSSDEVVSSSSSDDPSESPISSSPISILPPTVQETSSEPPLQHHASSVKTSAAVVSSTYLNTILTSSPLHQGQTAGGTTSVIMPGSQKAEHDKSTETVPEDKPAWNQSFPSTSNPVSSTTKNTATDSISIRPDAGQSSKHGSASTANTSHSIETPKQSAPSPPSSSQHASQHQEQQNQPRASSTSSSAPANPTTQESFFKSVHKRLQALESNATLSLQYIESQSLLLRTAFQAVEKRQLKKTETFLASLNASVTTELARFKGDYERLWEGVVIEMEIQRRQSEREVLMVSERLRLMAEELVWQKRVGVVQSTLILLCLGLVIFARSGMGATLEVPLLQQLGRSKWRGQRFPSSYYGGSPPQSPDLVSPSSPRADDIDFASPTSDDMTSKDKWDGRRQRGVFWRRGSRDTPIGRSNSEFRRSTGADLSEGTEDRPATRDGAATASSPIDRLDDSIEELSLRVQAATPEELDSARVEDGPDGPTDHDLSRLAAYNDGALAGSQSLDSGLTEQESRGFDYDSDGLNVNDESGVESSMPKETQSSPSTPGGTRDRPGILGREIEIPEWPEGMAL